MQDYNSKSDYNYDFENIRIQSDDILRIKISSKSVDLASLYDIRQQNNNPNSLLAYQLEGYLVDSNGYINIPVM